MVAPTTGLSVLSFDDTLRTAATAISAKGVVTGVTCPVGSDCAGFVSDSTGARMRLLVTTGAYTTGTAVNAAGHVVGWQLTSHEVHAFATRARAGRLVDIGSLGGTSTRAYGINDKDQITGVSYASGDVLDFHVFLKDGRAPMRDVGIMGTGAAINASGQIAGYGFKSALDDQQGFVTAPDGGAVTWIDELPRAFNTAMLALNASGQAVGWTDVTTDQFPIRRAVVTNPGTSTMSFLDDLVALPAAVGLVEGDGIADDGRIVASGSDGHVDVLRPLAAD